MILQSGYLMATASRCLVHEGGTGVQQHRQVVMDGVAPQIVVFGILRVKPGVHGKELDAPHAQVFPAFDHLLSPSLLGGVQRHEGDRMIGVPGTVRRHVAVGRPQPRQPRFTTKYNGL